MAEVGRVAVCDPDALLPGGFWAAVAVWLERPQVANKRLCGVLLEARRRAPLPCAEVRDPRLSAGAAQATAGRGPEEFPGRLQQEGDQREAAGAPLLAGALGQPGKAGVGEGDFASSNLDALWDDFFRSLAGDSREIMAFLTGSRAGSQPEAQHELDMVLRTIIPKKSQHCPLTAPRREIAVQDVPNGTITFLPLEEDNKGNLKVKMSNVYQIQLGHSKEECSTGCVPTSTGHVVVSKFHGETHKYMLYDQVVLSTMKRSKAERWHSDGIVYPKSTWLGGDLLEKLARWSVERKRSGFKTSLSLISISKYSKTYQELKEKYKGLVKVWPEVTDPEKFVYEDVAIAAYLLILWEQERAERGVAAKQSFADLGCGNGLLVHILSSEGHPGRGIDVRRRKIWDMYGPQTHLEEGAITPNDKTLFPDVDWLIGNHSDELTPWIPVMAARSSYSCRFFVLPCCFFDFTGKYRRRQSTKTQYREYLDFIKEVGLTCGFHVEEDCLRIPSTKRVCLLGKSRTYPPSQEVPIDVQRTQYINSRQSCPRNCPGRGPTPPLPAAVGKTGHPDGRRVGGAEPGVEARPEGRWLTGFHPREKAECPKNCAALPWDFVDQVVLHVANLLLGGNQLNTRSPQSGSLKTWNRGESLSLAEVASELDRETLQRLKRECGGLQTLLKNNHQVFEVLKGRVHIRDWREERLQKEKQPKAKQRLFSEAFKTRVCWFFTHHPDGCVLPSDRCPFAHGPAELRPSQTPKKKKQAL